MKLLYTVIETSKTNSTYVGFLLTDITLNASLARAVTIVIANSKETHTMYRFSFLLPTDTSLVNKINIYYHDSLPGLTHVCVQV